MNYSICEIASKNHDRSLRERFSGFAAVPPEKEIRKRARPENRDFKNARTEY